MLGRTWPGSARVHETGLAPRTAKVSAKTSDPVGHTATVSAKTPDPVGHTAKVLAKTPDPVGHTPNV